MDDQLTIPGLMAHRRREDADRQALVSDDEAITYRGLDDASSDLAARFVAAGVGKNDRVGLLMPNGIDWAVTALAAMRIGAVLVPLSTLLRPPELLAQLNAAAVSALVTVRAYRNRCYVDDLDAVAPGISECSAANRHVAAPNLRAVWVAGELPEAAASGELVSALERSVCPADDMVILFTSGSRGAPKGVVHTHGGALRATAAGLPIRCIGPGERLYIPMPFFWTGGFGGGLMSVLVAGATLLTESDPEPARTIRFLERERVTLFRGWPDQAARIAAHPSFEDADLGSLGPGSLPAVLPPEQRPAPGARSNLFGMTESFGPYCADRLDLDLPEAERGSCGRPFADVNVRVVDPDDGRPAPAGVEGEIQIRGPNVMRGICGRHRSSVFTADGYYPTADLGRLDADGYLWYSGRLDDMFKVKGATVYPSEVEAALRSLPGVAAAFATNVAGGDGLDEVGVLVVSSSGVEALAAGVRERLSSFKVPTRWLVTGDAGAVPLMATGKVDKAQLQQLLRDCATREHNEQGTGA